MREEFNMNWDKTERGFSLWIYQMKKGLVEEIREWKAKDQSAASTEETADQTLWRVAEIPETTRKDVKERARNVSQARNSLKKVIDKERRQNQLRLQVDRHYKRAMASAAYTTAQSAKRMATTLVRLLSAFNGTSQETTETQEQLSTTASAISVSVLVAIWNTPEDSLDGPPTVEEEPDKVSPNITPPTTPTEQMDGIGAVGTPEE